MTRKVIQFTIIFLASLTMLGCDRVADASPNEVLSNYFDALSKGRYEESYSYVSADDKAVKDLQSYLKENEDNPFAQAIENTVSYKILKIEKSDKKATADVRITGPDIRSMFSDIMGAAFKSAFSGDEKEMERTLAKKLESGKVPLTTEKETFKLVKEENGWKVFLDWKTEKIKKERQAKIRGLLAKAEELKKSKKLYGAAEKYEQILELESGMVDTKLPRPWLKNTKERLNETKKEIKSFEGKQTYIKNVVLYDLKAKYYNKTYISSEGVPGVEFKIKNKGNRTLKEVEVTVYFKDASGVIIAEEGYRPVKNTTNLLKPNYIWQKRGEFYRADSVPSEWKEGAISAKITNIEFEE